ncbi:MAG: glycosyltransferase family 4 protein, partial [Burkholderiales bacterium]|nr:glycosyltransferase family 4 protein [Burkholderiales bacterium]
RGHHVEFVTNRPPGLPETAVVDGFEVHRLQAGRGRKHREFRLWFNLLRHVWKRRHRLDVLHSHGAYIAHAFMGPLARLAGLRSLVKASLAHDDLQGLSRPLVGTLHRLMLRRIDAYVAISQDLVQEFRDGGLEPRRIHHLPNGVDTERYSPVPPAQVPALRAALALPPAVPVALYVGVLDQRKNILWLAEQWVRQDGFGTGAMLVAVGPQGRDDLGGRLRAQLAALAQAHPQRFMLREHCADVAPYYRCASLLVLPSHKEGLPNVMLEAMACGLPCVAARASGSRELVLEGQTGLVYEPDDAAGLAAAVRRCLDPQAAAWPAQARRLAEQRYAIDLIAARYEALYRQLLAPR